MNDDKKYKVIRGMKYTNYELLLAGSFWGSVISNSVNKHLFNDSYLGDGVSLTLISVYIFLSFSKAKYYTKEFLAIKEYYSKIIENYSKFLDELELSNPVSISSMFSNMVEDGYLSVDKTFNFDRRKVYDYSRFGGVNIINGHGVCRHYASLLTDILNNRNIEAINLGVCFPDYKFSIELLDDKTLGQSREEIYKTVRNFFINPDDCRQLMQVFDQFRSECDKGISVGISEEKDKNIILRMLGNHAITFAYQDGLGYYLDPTIGRIYTRNLDSFSLCDDSVKCIPIKLPLSGLINGINHSDPFYRHLLSNPPSLERGEINELIISSDKLYRDNIDMCESFYEDNKDYYKEVAENLKTLRVNFRTRK